MKNMIHAGLIAFAVGALSPQTAQSQGTLYLSSLSQPSASSAAVGSDSWQAAIVFTGTNPGGYALNSVQLAMTPGSGSPNGFTVMLYSESTQPALGSEPGSSLGTFSGSTDPVAGGLFSYTAPDFTLSPSSTYFIVATAGTPVASGAYAWSIENTSSPSSSGGWSTPDVVYKSSDGLSWEPTLFNYNYPQFALTATAVPEPETLYLMGLPALLFLAWRRWRAKAQAR